MKTRGKVKLVMKNMRCIAPFADWARDRLDTVGPTWKGYGVGRYRFGYLSDPSDRVERHSAKETAEDFGVSRARVFWVDLRLALRYPFSMMRDWYSCIRNAPTMFKYWDHLEKLREEEQDQQQDEEEPELWWVYDEDEIDLPEGLFDEEEERQNEQPPAETEQVSAAQPDAETLALCEKIIGGEMDASTLDEAQLFKVSIAMRQRADALEEELSQGSTEEA